MFSARYGKIQETMEKSMVKQNSVKKKLELVFSRSYGRRQREDIASVLRDDFEVSVLTSKRSFRGPYEVLIIMFVFFEIFGIRKFLHSFMGEMGKMLVHKIFLSAKEKDLDRVTVWIKTKEPRRREIVQAKSEEELHREIKRLLMEFGKEPEQGPS